ncbi:MAG: hypothetical protein A2Y08_01465 [Planctomycetes bacterium GWA2_40_7]|nr:MAG: hypothetical protein A2Y08_01465 [Planctomycetes bacterium GWA2_40_7]
MSHLVTINVELRNKQAVTAACNRLKWEVKENTKVKYHDGSVAEGMAVYIPGWSYPIVITDNGTVKGDNYGGVWGDLALLNKLKQAYGVEVARSLMKRHAVPIIETQNQDGSMTLTVRY